MPSTLNPGTLRFVRHGTRFPGPLWYLALDPNAAPAGVSAETLYNGGMRDKSAGNSDLAIEQFQNYLKWFGNTDLAPNAQYYIGEIKYLRGDLDGALMAFDTFLEKYPDNPKTSDAMLQKGRALVKSGFKARPATPGKNDALGSLPFRLHALRWR